MSWCLSFAKKKSPALLLEMKVNETGTNVYPSRKQMKYNGMEGVQYEA